MKVVNKTTVAVYNFLSMLINTVIKVSITLQSIIFKKHQHLKTVCLMNSGRCGR